MLSLLIESAVRSTALLLAAWTILRLCRVRSLETQRLVCAALVLSSLSMPALMRLQPIRTAAPPVAVWMPLPQAALPVPVAGPEPQGRQPTDWTFPAALGYAAVSGILLLRIGAGLLLGARLRRRAAVLREPWVGESDVRVASPLSVPVTFGSTILLPSNWPDWNASTRQAVLLHERSHAKRYDFFLLLASRLNSAVFWFNPFSWLLERRLTLLVEMIGDEEAIAQTGRSVYAGILKEFSRKEPHRAMAAVPMAKPSTVQRRIARLLFETAAPRGLSRLSKAALWIGLLPFVGMAAGSAWQETFEVPPRFMAAVGTHTFIAESPEEQIAAVSQNSAAPASPLPPAASPAAPQVGTPAPTSSSYLARWPEQEVEPIISQDEWAAFEKLGRLEEQEMFIRQFWLRRDPTPGTPPNEFRDEYYMRIASANTRFSTAATPGWKTARGRVFIAYGPPARVETRAGTFYRPSEQGGASTSVPMEEWHYTMPAAGGDVRFVFAGGRPDGDYVLLEQSQLQPRPAQ